MEYKANHPPDKQRNEERAEIKGRREGDGNVGKGKGEGEERDRG